MYELNQIKLNYQLESVQRLENVSDEDYFGEKYKEYVSNSLLKLINPEEGGNPARYLVGNKGTTSSGAFELGTAVHRMILERDKYYVNDIEKPNGKVGLVIDTYFSLLQEGVDEVKAIRDACIANDYYKGSLTDNRIEKVLELGKEYLEYLQGKVSCPDCITLSSEMKTKLDGCLISVQNNPLIKALLYNTKHTKEFNEDVITLSVECTVPSINENVFEDITTTIHLKAKIDNWSIDTVNKVLTLNDLKTTGASISTFAGTNIEVLAAGGELRRYQTEGSFQKFRYYRQMAMYAMMLKAYAEQVYGFDDSWTFDVNMIVVETNAPHLSHVFSVTKQWLDKGDYEVCSLLKRVAFHKVNGWDAFIDLNRNIITPI